MHLSKRIWRCQVMMKTVVFFQVIGLGRVASFVVNYSTNPFASSGLFNCRKVCDYDDLSRIANCESRRLHNVPFSTGCEDTTTLKIGGNNIQSLDAKRLSGYASVKTLDASRNYITEFDSETFINLKQLRNIIIQQNQLNYLKNGTFAGTEMKLKTVVLNNNELTYIHENAFIGLRQLKSLYLNDNKLTQVSVGIFRGLISLQKLYLHNNELHSLPTGLFSGLNSLREVHLSSNKLIRIPSPQSLDHVEYKVFDISNNELNQSGNIVPYLGISDRVFMGGNPLICDCDFPLIQKWYRNKSETEKQHYESRRPVMCGEYYLITDPIFACTHTDETTGTDFGTSWTGIPDDDVEFVDPISDIVQSPGEILHAREDLSNNPCSKFNLYEKKEKDDTILLYCAVILTVFFVAWILKTVSEFLPSKRK